MQDFKDKPLDVEQARFIYKEFVSAESHLMLNLSAKTRHSLTMIFEEDDDDVKIDKDVFHIAEREIINLMAYDSFGRLASTKEYKRYSKRKSRLSVKADVTRDFSRILE